MSSHSSNNSNADMEVIDAEDLEDSPPPGDDNEAEDVTPVVENKESIEVKDTTSGGDTETIGEIGEVSTTTEESVARNITAVNDDDDDPPIEILEAPTPPLSLVVPSEPEAEIATKVEIPEPAAAAPEPVASVPEPVASVPEPVEAVPEPEPAAPKAATAPAAAAAPSPSPAVDPAPAPAPAPAPKPQAVSVRPAVTAERPAATLEEVDDEEDDDDIDETLTERLIGLTEMFPDFVRNGSVSLVKGSWSLAQSCYSLTRAASWVVFSSATILFMPVMIESERLQIQDQQKAQKNQILLGPGAAVSGGPSLGPPPI